MPRPDRLSSRWGYVGSMFVREDLRDRGIGSALLIGSKERSVVELVHGAPPIATAGPPAASNVTTDRACAKMRCMDKTPSELIDARIEELPDWRGETLARIRALVHEADPDVVETWKWRGVPIWEHDGIVCTGETYKNVVKTTFAKGASLEDPSGLFNSSLEGNTRRAIDFHESEDIDEEAFKALVRAAVELNTSGGA
jgi:hypothetical protein